ncbi:hypothetical protein Pnap_4129 (plasmid) [Polaromonas naphthalenivorans CJ2]|uniref:Uncharacterized protein n=1 Tax=Polaromonas naphthalenivorans (strain CJ2) TaxID=365044 RepID=A1VUU0_POLNA|nr:hypothetical protein Pnap_4129 [Polaromonas naphthalenivorans CJ2]
MVKLRQEIHGIEHARERSNGHPRATLFKRHDRVRAHARKEGQITLIHRSGTACEGNALAKCDEFIAWKNGKWCSAHYPNRNLKFYFRLLFG